VIPPAIFFYYSTLFDSRFKTLQQNPPYRLFQYHQLVMDEMEKRGYSPAPEWKNPMYRGKSCEAFFDLPTVERNVPIYPEHDEVYLAECLANLEQKGIYLT
ncbi:pyrimidine dimer DNA glycosylase/endonuclease V, partial [Enterococcus faecium]|uniref:pyrimidine dimer DNA glycosylase/endonuclease V n=1 Tax=Enterococcus faecium TaxID=1352 RepID=UPI003F8A1CDB